MGITVKKARELFGMHENTIRSMIDKKILIAEKRVDGRYAQWYIEEDSIAELYLNKNLEKLLIKYPELKKIFLEKIKNDILTPKLDKTWDL